MSRVNRFVKRRHFLQVLGFSSAGMAAITVGNSIVGATPSNSVPSSPTTKVDAHTNKNAPASIKPVSPEDALKLLLEGNNRFVSQKSMHPHQSIKIVHALAGEQHPFACVLGCADSRVPSEILFDQGIGDIFDVRIAGNIASDEAIASLEYSTLYLKSRLIVVLGHQSCGAIKAALSDDLFPGRIGYLVESIKPIVEKVKSKATNNNALNDAVNANIRYQVQKLKDSSTVLAKLINEGNLKIVGARYDLDTGKVTVI
jgi:carbonic anhydrase